MNVALVLAIFTATVNLSTAAAHFAISRAPGWRSSRAFALIAFTGALYSGGNIVSAAPDLPRWIYVAAAYFNYFAATLHILSWFPWVFGGPESRVSRIPGPLRALTAFALALGVFLLLTRIHLVPEPYELPVPWAHVVYHYLPTTQVGHAYGYFLFALLLVPFGALAWRALRGERGLWPVVAGFTVFSGCALVEVLVANGNMVWLSPADLGFLAVVLPTSTIVLRRFIQDAHRLNTLTGRLAGEVRERTEERDRAQSALLESERLAALGQLAAGVGHEINNPLTYLQLALDRVHSHLDSAHAPTDVRRSIEDARDGAWRIQKVVEGLRAYSRRHALREPLDLREVARNALKVAQPRLRHVAMLETQLVETPLAEGEEPRLVQALVNLLNNAAQAVAEGGGNGRIRLSTGTTPAGEPFLEVEDDGPGIPEQHRARLAEPYFTTRGPSGGLGLGLFVTRGIVDAHGGRLEFSPVAPHGTRMRVVLPALPGDAPPAANRGEETRAGRSAAPAPLEFVPAPAGPNGRPRLLAVDDEPMLLRLLTQMLQNEWAVTDAADGDEALHLIQHQHFDVVLCDLMMPGLSGVQLAARIAELNPALRERMVFMTGGALTPEADEFLARPGVVSVAKPMDFHALRVLLKDRLQPQAGGRD